MQEISGIGLSGIDIVLDMALQCWQLKVRNTVLRVTILFARDSKKLVTVITVDNKSGEDQIRVTKRVRFDMGYKKRQWAKLIWQAERRANGAARGRWSAHIELPLGVSKCFCVAGDSEKGTGKHIKSPTLTLQNMWHHSNQRNLKMLKLGTSCH